MFGHVVVTAFWLYWTSRSESYYCARKMDRMWRECFSQSVTKREIVFGGTATMISILFLIFAAFEMRLESYPEHIKFLPVLTNLLDNTNGTGPAVRWFYIISILCGPVTAILLIVGILRVGVLLANGCYIFFRWSSFPSSILNYLLIFPAQQMASHTMGCDNNGCVGHNMRWILPNHTVHNCTYIDHR